MFSFSQYRISILVFHVDTSVDVFLLREEAVGDCEGKTKEFSFVFVLFLETPRLRTQKIVLQFRQNYINTEHKMIDFLEQNEFQICFRDSKQTWTSRC